MSRATFTFFGSRAVFHDVRRISFGWKFHVIADPANFFAVFRVIRPIAASRLCVLKALSDPGLLRGMEGTVQQGKAFTLYFPQSAIPAGAAGLGEDLRVALESAFPAPVQIIHERSFRGSPFVYYRFGEYDAAGNVIGKMWDPAFGSVFRCRDGHRWCRDREGRKWLCGPEGVLWRDRQASLHKPGWVDDPFAERLIS